MRRPLAWLPQSPEQIGTKFTLYNERILDGERITPESLGSKYDEFLPTKVIIHGFLHHGKKDWILDMKDAILEESNVNVILVDWSKGNGFPYTQATANTQIVGAVLAKLVNALCVEKRAKPADFHIIGHSLGSHIAGYTGSHVLGIGKITGLDPAGPYFEYTDERVRLDPSDALYVEAIHTDGSPNLHVGLGLLQPIAHTDYYPNAGRDQPKCPQTSGKILSAIWNLVTINPDGLEENLACSHMAAVYFYLDSIKNPCKYTAYPCKGQDDFNSGKCLKCSGEKGCNRMSYWSDETTERGSLYLSTQSPFDMNTFCLQHYLTTLYSNKIYKLVQTRGKFTVTLETETGILSSTELLDNSATTFRADSVESRLISLMKPLSEEVNALYVTFTKTPNLLSSWMYDNSWSFKVKHFF